jgi:hypothetical protein
MVDKGRLDMGHLRMIWTSLPIPNGPTAVRSDLPIGLKEDMKLFHLALPAAEAPYFFEDNTRSTATLGVVGAGPQITVRVRIRHRDEVAFNILLMIATVAAIDRQSGRPRRRIYAGPPSGRSSAYGPPGAAEPSR